MAHLTEKRLKEMEEEMNRFEEEILSTKAAAAAAELAAAREAQANARKIIGAGTFNRMQAEIANKSSNSLALHSSKSSEENSILDSVIAGALPPPPPPPPIFDTQGGMTPPSGSAGFNLRPPPPPPTFVPPQLHNRPMLPPRPPFPPRSMLPGAPPPPPPPGMHGMMRQPQPNPNMMGRLPSFMQNHMMAMRSGMQPYPFPQNSVPPGSGGGVVHQPLEKPKVVYAAPPMKRVIAETKEPEKPKVADVVEKPPEPKKPHVEPAAKKLAMHGGIELNVPVEEIEAEKKMNYVVPAVAPSTSVEATPAPSDGAKKKEKKKKFVRMAASSTWEDPTLAEWELDDFRMFCGDLGNEVTDETLARTFSKYPTFLKAKVVRDKRTNKTKGFGFVSFKDPNDFMKAMREMNGKYVGNRPIKLRKSTWRDRQIDIVKKKDKEKKRLGFR